MKHILMLNTLPIINFDSKKNNQKTAGNQTLYNTLKGYSENNIAVTMITFFDVPAINNPFPNVTIKRSVFFKIFNFSLKLKKMLNKFLKQETQRGTNNDIRRTGSKVFFEFWNFFGYIEGMYYSWKEKPNLIYGYEIYSTSPAKRIADRMNLPVVSRFQGTELGFFIKDQEKFDEAVYYIKGTEVKTDLVIMANDGTDGNKVLNKLGFEPSRIRFWVNGLHNKKKYLEYDKDVNYRVKLGLPEDAVVLCTANRFVDWKRIDRIINVMNELEKKNLSFYLVAIGDGPEKEFLINLVKKLKLDNVIFTGALEHEETIYHIANADLYITLNHSGNLGNSILEALALGTVVCTLKNESVEYVLKNDYNSVLFSSTDESEIAQILFNLINDKKKIENIKINARDYARNNLLSWSERMNLEITEIQKLMHTK